MSFLPLFGCFHKSKQSGANLQGDSINPPANFPHDMVHVNGLSARHSSKSNRSVNDDFALFSQKHRFSSVLVDFMVDFFASTAASTARWAGRHKTKKARQPSDCQAFSSVGVTGFEPATTRPPDVYSNRTELRPDYPFPTAPDIRYLSVWDCKYSIFFRNIHISASFFSIFAGDETFLPPSGRAHSPFGRRLRLLRSPHAR